MKQTFFIAVVIFVAGTSIPSWAGPQIDAIDFNRDIRPILSDNCFHCHGPDNEKRKANLRLDIEDAAKADLDGNSAIVPGKPDDSELILRIMSTDEAMPPVKSGKKLTDAEKAMLRRWISEGGRYDKHWSFDPPKRPSVPKTSNQSWARNSIDVFILAKLETEKLNPSKEADKSVLIRRVTLDLTGVPATIQEVAAFLADDSAKAYERVVDRLLASPRYGERMAVPWLDAARYADTMGYQADWERYQWRWRSWVIDAYNRNQRFDQFTIEQLAGDLLPKPTIEQLIATGFNRNHRINDEGGIIPAEYLVEYVVDRVETTAGTWMGLTMGCARCHDHKFDPITQEDFYRFFAFFHNVPEKGKEGRNGYATPHMRVAVRGMQPEYETVKQKVAKREAAVRASKTPKAKPLQQALAAAKKELKQFEATHTTYIMVMREMEKPRDTHILQRGAYNAPGKKVSKGIPAESLGPLPTGAPVNRLGLARWLVSGKHPLTARVIVNRYWQMLFGAGLVTTTEDFGLQGEYPSHPQLLDWLATEYPRIGWNTKEILKLIVMSATYRQRSESTEHLRAKDPLNRLLARQSRLRLPSEMVRDQALFASGLLIEKIGGPSVKPYQPKGLWSEVSFQSKKRSTDFHIQDTGQKLYRRSLYTFWKRSMPPPAMATFDAPSREMCVLQRERTNTPLQALALMNDVTYVEACRVLAQRSIKEGGRTTSDRLSFTFRCLLSRSPNAYELTLLQSGYAKRLAFFQKNVAAATKLIQVGASKPDANIDQAQLAALTTVAMNVLNLDETITRE